MPKEVEVHFDITHELLHETILPDFLEWLTVFDEGKWRPEKYNNAEPVRYTYSTGSVDKVLQRWRADNIGMILKRVSAPQYELDFGGEHRKLLVMNELNAYFDSSLFRKSQSTDACLAFLNSVYMRLKPAYGYAVHRKDYLAKNMKITYPEGENVSRIETWVGRDLSKCLRGIYWANWFGPVYVDFLGKERFDSAPCYRKEALADGGYLILTAESPLQFESSQAKSIEEALREHLGPNAFYDIRAPHRQTRSPWNSKFVN